jgi:uracil-DNA glycosylase family 4
MKLAGPEPKHPTVLLPCPECPFGGPRVGSRGNPEAPIVFIGEAPGLQEMQHGIPLVGPSGEVFWQTLSREFQGCDPTDVLVLNACQCLPPRSKDTQKSLAAVNRATQICSLRLRDQVLQYPRRLVVPMGNFALRSLTSNYGYKITQIRGQLLPTDLASVGLLPVIHPAALLRGTGSYRIYREDIRYASTLMAGGSRKKEITPQWLVARSPDEVAHICNELISHEFVAADTETGGFNHLTDEIPAVGLCASPEMVYIVPGELVQYLKPLFNSPAKFIWHNGKFDMRFMRREIPEARCDEDTMLLSYTIDEQGGIHDLEQIGNDILGAPDYKHMLKPYLPNRKTSFRVIPEPVLHHYLALDTSNTLQIFRILRSRVAADANMEKLYTRTLIPASDFLYRIETRGMMVCPNRVKYQSENLQKNIDDAYATMQTVAAQAGVVGEINPNSPLQLQKLFWDLIKLKPPFPNDRSTRKEVLDKLPPHPAVKALKQFRKAAKAKSTYVTSLERNVNVDGRVHPTFLIHGTRTGRFSSRGPNMQNIPRGTAIRGMYMASPGHVFVKADLNQAELRSLAILSGDDYLLSVYAAGSTRKLHHETAEEFYPGWTARGRDSTYLGKEQIIRAKAVNFGIVYGRQAPSIAEEYRISTREAQQFIDRWANRSPKAWAFMTKCRNAPVLGQNLITVFGRRKRHWLVTRENVGGLQNEASNFPHQSMSHDICLHGGMKAAPLLSPYNIFPCNEIHDEVMFECPDIPELVAFCKYVIVRCLESIAPEWGLTEIPFIAEADVGRRWNIYRNPKEFAYDYTPASDDWWVPNSAVLNAIAASPSDTGLLGSKLLMPASERIVGTADSFQGFDRVREDEDWGDDDPEAVWGPLPSAELDRGDVI